MSTEIIQRVKEDLQRLFPGEDISIMSAYKIQKVKDQQHIEERIQRLFSGKEISNKINEWIILCHGSEQLAINQLHMWEKEAERRIKIKVIQEEFKQIFPDDCERRLNDWLQLYDKGLHEQAEILLQTWKKSNNNISLGHEVKATMIDQYEEDYKKALYAIDNDVKKLVESGCEMKAIMVLSDNLQKIGKIHELLSNFYGLLYRSIGALERFGSERLKQLGHAPVTLYAQLKEMRLDASDEILEKMVLDYLNKVGFQRSHWYINARVLTEIEYLIDTLRILIEPEFIPLEIEEQKDNGQSAQDRYVPSNVKIAVWRRDEGKCVKCTSQEKLEYDHIIPVSKGGSNT
jgi:hypothetical protein